MPLGGIIFDMDGVLCDSEPFICQAAVELFRERFGLNVKPDDFLPFVGTGEDRYLGGVAEKYGVQLQMPQDKQRLYDLYLRAIRGKLQPLPGVHDFIDAARRRGLKLAVATSADRVKMRGNLAELRLPLENFDAIVTGSDVARKKPAPDIFLTAADKLALPASRCLVIEDAPNGLQAARSAGAFALGITSSFSSQALAEAGAQWTAPDLARVPDDLWKL